MKKVPVFLLICLFVLSFFSIANATLITIGTADYDSNDSGVIDADESYKLIWDDDNNGNSVVWLDYSNAGANWDAQMSWAAGLDSALTINLDAGYSVIWNDTSWRLPSASSVIGYNTSSEMGHLYFDELGLQSSADRGSQLVTSAELNATSFDNLIAHYSWSNTEHDGDHSSHIAWRFGMNDGYQGGGIKNVNHYGIALRTGQVSMAPVPEPATMLLFGIGLLSLAGVNRKKQK